MLGCEFIYEYNVPPPLRYPLRSFSGPTTTAIDEGESQYKQVFLGGRGDEDG
jgi:hypothetical protein